MFIAAWGGQNIDLHRISQLYIYIYIFNTPGTLLWVGNRLRHTWFTCMGNLCIKRIINSESIVSISNAHICYTRCSRYFYILRWRVTAVWNRRISVVSYCRGRKENNNNTYRCTISRVETMQFRPVPTSVSIHRLFCYNNIKKFLYLTCNDSCA